MAFYELPRVNFTFRKIRRLGTPNVKSVLDNFPSLGRYHKIGNTSPSELSARLWT